MNAISPCPVREHLCRLAAQGGSAEEVENLAKHLEECDRCGEEVDRLLAADPIVATLRSSAGKPIESSQILEDVQQRLRQLRPAADVAREARQLQDSADDTQATAAGQTASFSPELSSEDSAGTGFLGPAQKPGELGRLANYRILKKLGEGGMGLVFLAEDELLRRKVALKTMRPSMAANPESRERFLREARATAAIEHEHIVTIHQVGEDRSVPFLAMPLLKGEPLEARLKQAGKLPAPEALRIAAEMAEGLAAAHRQGLIHRDIKPGNVWLEGDAGKVRLLDFGLAHSQREEATLTQSGVILGTPAFMAPEQARGEAIDDRADLFSLGCVLYVMLTGQRPFKGENAITVLTALAMENPPAPQSLTSEVPEELGELTMRLLAKDPAGRPASAGEVAGALRDMLRRASDMIAAESAPASALKGRGDRRVRWPMLAAGLLLGAAGLVAAATIIIRIKNKWGGETTVEVADDSQISIERKQGDGTLPCPASGRGAGGEAASRRPPPLARPSMSAAEAKQVQQQWAQYLGVPVEQTNSVGMDLVLIPPGEFDMGSTPEEIARALEEGKKTTAPVYLDQVPGEGPRHRVKITRPFYLGMYPVTQAEYEKLTGINPSAFTAKQADVSIFKPPLPDEEAKLREYGVVSVQGNDTSRHPVETVNWEDAMEFCRRLSAAAAERAAGRVYRLPTEAEWEYACRAGTTTRWYCGDEEAGLGYVAWFKGNSAGPGHGTMTHPVGQKKPNAWGLYEMHGNVWQWCADWFDADYYKQSPLPDPIGPPGGVFRVLRGSSWHCEPVFCRSAFRQPRPPLHRSHSRGFRVVCEIAATPAGVAAAAPAKPGATAPQPTVTPVPNPQSPIPAPAVAPFDAAKAREHQETWAKHLGVPVEQTNSIGMKLVLIPPGEFDMGSTPEEIAWALEEGKKAKLPEWYFNGVQYEAPRHRVRITKPFYLGMYPVTQGEYAKVMGVNPSCFTAQQMDASAFRPPIYHFSPEESRKKELESRQRAATLMAGRDTTRYPVETVSWDDCVEFCRKLTALPGERAAGRDYRLPTEAEWEYACRAGTTTRWFFGDDVARLFEYAWYDANGSSLTHPVGQKDPNPWRLYDMLGNAAQWCNDLSTGDYYKQSPREDPQGLDAALVVAVWGDRPNHMYRGGSTCQSAYECRPAYRNSLPHGARTSCHGFRVAIGIAAKVPLDAQSTTPAPPASPAQTASPSTTPAPAVAPFDAAKAREHQETWAKHLGVPVEQANSIGMKLVLIPPGQFEMGSTAEEIAWALQEGKKTKQPEFVFNNIQREAPRHQVRITRPFYLGMFPVTQAEYAKVMGLNPSSFTAHQMDPSVLESPGYDLGPSPKGADRNLVLTQRQLFAKLLAGRDTSRHPVETVSWDDCAEFCRKLSALAGERAAGRVYRLPTEAEWEYACRAGTTSRWFSGDDPARLFTCAWYSENSGTMTHPVGQRGPNAWRLYDMHGNVSQWCSDLALPGWSSESAGYYYRQSPRDDPQGPDIAEIAPGIPARMVRGGCFAQDAFACRSASRLTTVQTYHCVDRGFRVAVGIAAKERVSALPASTAPAASPSRSP